MIRQVGRVVPLVLAALFVVSQVQGQEQYFSAGAKVNVLPWYNFYKVDEFGKPIPPTVPAGSVTNPGGVPMAYIQTWVSWSAYGAGSQSRNPWYGLDGAHNHTQVGYYPSASPNNRGYFDIALPATITINEISALFSHGPEKYIVWYSTTGFDNMKVLVAEKTGGTDLVDTFAPKAVQYLRFEYIGTGSQHIIMREIKAFAAHPETIKLSAGFNILDDPVINSIPVTDYSANFSGASSVFNHNPLSMLNPLGSAGYFVKELGCDEGVSLIGASYGFYEDQRWYDLKIYVASEKPGPDNDAVWTLVAWIDRDTGPAGAVKFGEYEEDELGNITFVGFKATENVKFIKVEGTFNQGTCALIHFGLYAAPEPATMSLLALGGLALLRRRRGIA